MWIFLWWAVGLSLSTAVGLWIVRRHREYGLSVLMCLFAVYVVSANILVPRLIELPLGHGIIIATGSLIWPFTAQISDMINEVYGRRRALIAVAISYIANLLFVTFVLMALNTTPLWEEGRETFWRNYFSPAGRILFASSVSFVICQSLDVLIYSALKERFRSAESQATGRRLVLLTSIRSVSSDLVNMICDGALFAVLAFAFVLEPGALADLILGSILAKALIAVIDTPWLIIFRLGVRNVTRER